MKLFLSTLLSFVFISIFSAQGFAQRTHSVKDIFYLLPDTVFTNIHQLNFAKKDSFPMTERDKMIENFDAKRKKFTPNDPRFHVLLLNEKNNLLSASNGDLNFDVKLWTISPTESLIAVDGYYKEDMYSQTLKFYTYKGGKISPVKVFPEQFPLKLFFEPSYIEKQGVDQNLPVPDIFVVFSKTGGEELQARIQKESFDEELIGSKAPLAKLSYIRAKRPDVILNLQGGKFAITK